MFFCISIKSFFEYPLFLFAMGQIVCIESLGTLGTKDRRKHILNECTLLARFSQCIRFDTISILFVFFPPSTVPYLFSWLVFNTMLMPSRRRSVAGCVSDSVEGNTTTVPTYLYLRDVEVL